MKHPSAPALRRLLPLLAAFFILSHAAAQEATPSDSARGAVVTGHVADADSRRPVAYARVALLNAADSSLALSTMSDTLGRFRLSVEKRGLYLLGAELAEKASSLRPVDLTAADRRPVEADTLFLSPAATLLESLQVTASQQQITLRGDTLVYNADAFQVPPGATLGNLLSRLPGVTMEDGKILFHGKEVNKLLINGKEFFLGDMSIALENLPSEIIEDIAAYETKTDKDKREDTDTGERITVLDVGIKKEYMSTWIANADLAGGTHDHYSMKLFLTRFTDRLSLSAFGQANNLNDQSEASLGGNWGGGQYLPGYNTTRKAGLNAAWDNGKQEKEAGYLKAEGNLRFWHNDHRNEQSTYSETFYPGTAHNWGNTLDNTYQHSRIFSGNGRLSWQPDTLTRLEATVDFSHSKHHSENSSRSATFDSDPYRVPGTGDPLASLFSATPDDSLLRTAINRREDHALSDNSSTSFNSFLTLNRTVHPRGDRIVLIGQYSTTRNEADAFGRTDLRYFRQDENPRQLDNEYSRNPQRSYTAAAGVYYAAQFTKAFRAEARYAYVHLHNRGDYSLYALNTLPTWDDTGVHPFGTLPPADSLEMSIDRRNSYYRTQHQNMHQARFQLTLNLDQRFYANAGVGLSHFHTRLAYRRDALDTLARRNELYPNPHAYARYNFKNDGYIQFNYSGWVDYPDFVQTFDITDDSDPLLITHGNPDLESHWTHYFQTSFQKPVGKRKATLYARAEYSFETSSISQTESYDPATGIRQTRPENVEGSWNTSAYASASIPLDSKNRFNLSPSFRFYYREEYGYFVSADNPGLNQVNHNTDLQLTPALNFTYRQGKLFLGTYHNLFLGFERNSSSPASDQSCRILNSRIEAQYEFPWGMTASTDLGYYRMRGFTAATLNNDQWLWNANISQSFLKKKNLIVALEARDLLRQRLDEWASSSAYSRTSRKSLSIRNQSYVMAHLIYRFSVGKKAE